MLLIATVHVGSTVDDPLDLARKALQFLSASALADQGGSLKMSVAARDNSRFMKHVKSFAASRPSGREQTNRGFCEIMLTDSSPFAVAVSFVSDLLKDWPDILASAALCLDAEGFRWRGAPENSVGALRLIDWKAFSRGTPKQRSLLVAELTCRGASPTDPSVQTALEAIAGKTGIAFDRADDWFDSDRLLASFKEIWKAAAPDQPVDHADFLRCELRTGASPIGIEQRGSALTPSKPEPPASNRWWTVECRTKSRGRHLAHTARFDAVSGGHIHVLKETH